MPIPLGILAAAGVRPTAGGSYELIETITVGSGGAASVTFSNLNTYSSTYQHLQIRGVARTNANQVGDYLEVQFNGDTGANYAVHELYGNGSSVLSGGYPNLNFASFITPTGNNSASGNFGAGVFDILDPYETNKFTTVRNLGGYTTGNISLTSGLWRNTAAISSIKLEGGAGTSIVQYSRFSIYGLKAS